MAMFLHMRLSSRQRRGGWRTRFSGMRARWRRAGEPGIEGTRRVAREQAPGVWKRPETCVTGSGCDARNGSEWCRGARQKTPERETSEILVPSDGCPVAQAVRGEKLDFLALLKRIPAQMNFSVFYFCTALMGVCMCALSVTRNKRSKIAREEIRRDVIGRNLDGRRFARFSVAKIRRRSFQIALHDAHPLR